MKKKGFSQRGLGSYVPAHLNDSPFFKDIITEEKPNVNPSDEKTFEQKRIETPGASEVLSDLFRDNPNLTNLNGYADQRKELKSYQELLRSVKVNEQRIAEIDAEIKSLKSQKAQGGKGTRMAQLYEMRKTAEDRVKNQPLGSYPRGIYGIKKLLL